MTTIYASPNLFAWWIAYYLKKCTTDSAPSWHIHHAKSGGGQLLLCTDGLGWYQEAGKSAQALHPGDVVTIPAGVKHWHGAQKDCWFSHIAVECPGEETSNEWCEPVTDAEYAALDADCAQNP